MAYNSNIGSIYFDSESNAWMYVDDLGNLTEWISLDETGLSSPDDYPILPTGTNSNLGCGHEWVVYDSGFKSFEYCKKCNIEKDGLKDGQ